MGTYYQRTFASGIVPDDLTFSNAPSPSIVADGPGAVGLHAAGSASGSAATTVSLDNSLYTKFHGNNDSSYFELTVTTEAAGAVISYYRKVESEGCCDYFRFNVNGVQQEAISGFPGWVQKNVTLGAAGTYVLRWSFSTDGSVLSGISGFRIANIEISDVSDSTNSTKPVGGSSGGATGGGGSGGTGNMLGSFFLGSTMLGGDQDEGADSGTGNGVGNMLGGFFLGSTMLGGDVSGSGGSSTPISGGAIYQVVAAPSGLAVVTAALGAITAQLVASPAGSATVTDYLNAPWALSATTVNPTGITTYNGLTSYTITPGVAQGVRAQVGTFTLNRVGGFNGQVYRTNFSTGVETAYTSVSSGSNSFTWTNLDVGVGYFISKVEISVQGGGVAAKWEWSGEPYSYVSSTGLFIPKNLAASPTGTATVSADLTNYLYSPVFLDGTSNGSATVTDTTVTVSVLRGSISGTATATGSLGIPQKITVEASRGESTVVGNPDNAKVLESTGSNGSASMSVELVLVYYSNGSASVDANLGQHITPSAIVGTSTVTADPKRLDAYQGDSHGVASVVADDRLAMKLLISTIPCFATVSANLTFPRLFSGGSIVGTSSATGDAKIFNMAPGVISGIATVTGHLKYLNDLVYMTGQSDGEALVEGRDRQRFKFGQQFITGTSSVTGEVRRLWTLAATPMGVATVTFDHLTVHTIPPGPVTGTSTVVGEATMDVKWVATSNGVGTMAVLYTYGSYLLSTATPQGTADVHGRLIVPPQDFEVGACSGTASVIGQVRLPNLSLRATSRGGRIPYLDVQGKETGTYNDTLVTARLGVAFQFPGIFRAVGFAEVEAILLLNDSGLIRGNSRIDVTLDRLSTEYQARPAGTSKVRGTEEPPGRLEGRVTDAYAGVGRWFPGGFQRIYHYDYSLTMAPIQDLPEHAGLPGNALRHGASSSEFFGVAVNYNATVDSYTNGHVWDGTYAEWTLADTPGLDFRDYPELWDDEATARNNNYPVAYAKYPGPLRRKYQLLAPGTLGTWMVDTRGAGFNDKAMRGAPVGEARFNEPQSTVDMDLELKSSMKGTINGTAVVNAFALLLSFRYIVATGNVTALRYLLHEYNGNVTKSKDTRLPITRKNSELIQPVKQTNALYV